CHSSPASARNWSTSCAISPEAHYVSCGGMGPEDARAFFAAVGERVDRRLFGVRDALGLVLIGIVTDSHVLIDDVPGVGKTTLIRMLASLLGLRFARIQFTPDLMPSDITGTSVLNLKTNEVEFPPAPVFTQ